MTQSKKPVIIGLTGGIAAGKSTASAFLKTLGGIIIDADIIAKKEINHNKILKAKLVKTFGKSIYFKNGRLNRKALAAIVFDNEEKLKTLNKITHGAVLEKTGEIIKENPNAGFIVIDAPLLIESGAHKMCDKVILIVSEPGLRLERMLKRDNLKKADAEKRIASQMKDGEKSKFADYVIINSKTKNELYRELETAVFEILTRESVL